MTTKGTSVKETVEQSKTELRAQWEGFEFRVPAEGRVRVENVSYGEDSDEHVYVVSVESSIPFDCTCPAWEYHNPEGGCKHMVAVENQPAVLTAASVSDSGRQVATDGGDVDTSSYIDFGELHDQTTERPDDCRCDEQLGAGMVCIPCKRMNFGTPNRDQ
jgi:hypothetical protein